MHQIYHVEPALADGCCATACRRGWTRLIAARAGQAARATAMPTGTSFAQALSALVADGDVPRGQLQGVLDSERFNLLRSLEFFAGFGDVELWEVVHRAQWQRCHFGHALYRKGEEGNSFHIIAQGEVEVYRDGQRVAQLGAGTSVGEMAYLAPSPDAAHATAPTSSSPSRRPRSRSRPRAAAAEPGHAPPVRRRLHPRAGAPAACRARGAGASAAHPLKPRAAPAGPRRRVLQSRVGARRRGGAFAHAGDP